MMKTYKISTKIKFMGALLVLTMFTVILTTIYLNQKNVKDALVVNIAGKERMLTQRITKNIFYLYQIKSADFTELDKAISEFEFGINSLKDGNELMGIPPAPTDKIRSQIAKILILWNTFITNAKDFKSGILNNNEPLMQSTVSYINQSNNELLEEVDDLVTLFTQYTEEKTNFIRKFQYIAMAILLYLVLYSLIQLREIESHAREFIEKSKQIISNNINTPIETINVDAETEIVEVADNLNCFINKVNSAMQYSQAAVEQSKNASNKLEELTEQFDSIIGELKHSSTISSQLDKSEDIVLESTENLLNSTKKLQKLKNELDKLLISCKSGIAE